MKNCFLIAEHEVFIEDKVCFKHKEAFFFCGVCFACFFVVLFAIIAKAHAIIGAIVRF